MLEARKLTELCTESEFLLFIQNTDLLMFYRGTIPACVETAALIFSVKIGGAYSNHYVFIATTRKVKYFLCTL